MLPWVCSNVGNLLTAHVDGMQSDIMVKRAKYIENVNCLQQEFNFAAPKTLWKLNMIYNFHFSGCVLWDLTSPSFSKYMASIQKSFKLMFSLPHATHRYFLEVVTCTQHAALIIRKRFLGFLNMIEKSCKNAPSELLQIIRNDVRTITGSNIRQIKLEFNESNLDKIRIHKDMVMYSVPDNEMWRVGFVHEILQSQLRPLQSADDEIDKEIQNEVLNYFCIN